METTTSNPAPNTGRRNKFLTILCILTFIGSGWGIIEQVSTYLSADKYSRMANESIKVASKMIDSNAEKTGFTNELFNTLSNGLSPELIRKKAIAALISNLLTLLAGILIFNQKKIGFYIYIAGIVILILSPMILDKYIGIEAGLSTPVICVAFTIMYGVNLKNMNK